VGHADPCRDGILGPTEGDAMAPEPDFSAVRLEFAAQDLHEGRFPGTVFADDSMDLAFNEIQGNIPVRQDRTEAPRDGAEGNEWLCADTAGACHGRSCLPGGGALDVKQRDGPVPGPCRARPSARHAPPAPGDRRVPDHSAGGRNSPTSEGCLGIFSFPALSRSLALSIRSRSETLKR